MTSPVVSVVMVTCNVERFLEESIESILGQTFRDFEFVIVDFGSVDNTKSIISGFAEKDGRIRFHTIPNCGLAEARNSSCHFAQGPFLAIMDADDVALPNRLEREVEFMETHPEVGAVGGAVHWINAAGEPLMIARNPLGNSELQKTLLSHPVLWQPTVLMRSEAFAAAGGYRGIYAPAEDYDLWLRIAEHFHLANLEEVVLKYRIHGHQVSLRKREQQTLGKLGAQASASLRRQGKPDPLESVDRITPEILAELGIDEAQQQRELAAGYEQWIGHMFRAGEYAVATEAAAEFLQSPSKHVEQGRIAGLYLLLAKLYWRQRRIFRSVGAMSRAMVISPGVMAPILKAGFRRLGFA